MDSDIVLPCLGKLRAEDLLMPPTPPRFVSNGNEDPDALVILDFMLFYFAFL